MLMPQRSALGLGRVPRGGRPGGSGGGLSRPGRCRSPSGSLEPAGPALCPGSEAGEGTEAWHQSGEERPGQARVRAEMGKRPGREGRDGEGRSPKVTRLPSVQVPGQVLGTVAEPAQGPTAERWRSLSWAFLTLETVRSDEFLKHSICLVSRGRELSLQPTLEPGAPAAWPLPTSQKSPCRLQAPGCRVWLSASGTATLGRACHDNCGEGGRLGPPAWPGWRETAGESERKPPCKGENHLQINI